MGDKVLTVSEKVNGSTYNVTGLPNQDENGLAPVEAEFSDGKFILKEQKLSEAWNNPKYGDCDIYLSGKFNYNYKVYAAYGWYTEDPSVILTGYVREKGGGMTVYAGSCEKGKFLSFCLTWQIQAGENAGKGNFWPEVTISDMTKLKEASSVGFEAGGHNGREETTTMVLVPRVRQAVAIPLIAAGGIATGRGMLAAFALGAEGIQMGTRFALSEESSASDAFKKLCIGLQEGDTMLALKKLSPTRLIRNDFFRAVEEIGRASCRERV